MNSIYPTVANRGFYAGHNIAPDAETGAILPQRWMLEQQTARKTQTVVSANQLTSLSAMIAYISHKAGQSEFRIERSLADHYHVANVTCMAAEDFDDAIRYLADMIAA